MIKILLVDDEDYVREAFENILEVKGYDVYSASNGYEALKLLETLMPNLIISDIGMPNMNGYEFYERVRKNPDWNHIPFIFLTAFGQKEDVIRGKKLGVDDYLVKPVETEELLVTIEAKLQRTQQIIQKSQDDFNQLKNEILNSLSHEFKTPLAIIQGYTDMMISRKSAYSQENMKELLEKVKQSSERINGLVDDFLLLVNMETDDYIESDIKPAEITPYIGISIDKVKKYADQKNISIKRELSDALPKIKVSPKLLSDAFSRIISNAIKFSKKDSTIEVKSYHTDDKIFIEITDNGIGIPEDKIGRIFEQFYQVDRAIQEQQGVGLGLTIVKKIIEKSNGDIQIKSEINKGTSVTLSFPIADEDVRIMN
jgi:signal transduction histidine kinase